MNDVELVRADIFRVGDRVQYTEHAYEAGLVVRGTKRPTTGVVVGFSKSPYSVRVRLDGQKTSSSYSAAFWERPGRPAPEKAEL